MGSKKIGLTLAGGGAKGAYQIGVYKALLEAKIKIDGVTGTSIGSFNGAMIAADEFEKLEYFWTHENITKLMGVLDTVENLNKASLKDNIIASSSPFVTMVKNKGLSIDMLRDRLKEIVSEEKIRKSDIDFGLVTYKIKDKKGLYLFKEDIPKGKIVDYIVASCYLPVFQKKKLDDDSYYLDGCFCDNLPYNMLNEKGYDKIYVVELGSMGMYPKNKTNAEIIRIKPSRNLGGSLNTNKYKIKENIKLGYYDGIKVFKKLDGKNFIFKKRNDWFYEFLTRKVSKRTLMRAEVFFLTRNKKEIVLKSLEYILKKERKTYLNIYKPYKEIKRIKKERFNEDLIAYQFISELKLFWR